MNDLFSSSVPAPLRPVLTGITLAEAKTAHTAGLSDGIECVLCGRFDKIYRRPLNSGMAWALIALYKLDKKKPGWHHLLNEVDGLKGGDYGKLTEWGMIQRKDETKDDGNDSGFYRITAKGILFLQGKLRVKKYLYFYHDRLWPVDEGDAADTISVQEAIGKKFNYNELMQESEVL